MPLLHENGLAELLGVHVGAVIDSSARPACWPTATVDSLRYKTDTGCENRVRTPDAPDPPEAAL